ncbi:peptide ABC transporter substrate-binding protein [Polycladidibacter hongkongensis]|uniref:peptide ABC transporter substrate-binding protein n=1 Tax=Polycladidibacter hongkongensis TaxID=1647556 RepID=UPI000830E328|nr:peptide ABC transporter substrate-binding protein [Pseudovibrio hongkongensis]
MAIKFGTTTIAALLLAASSLSAAGETVYNRGNSADPETLDQHKTSTTYEAHILRDLYEGLVAYSAAGKIIPGAAISWDVSADGLVYTFKMREDAKWSNGDPVVAGDFVFSLRRIMDPATGAKYANVLYPINNAEAVNGGKLAVEELGVKALDDKNLQITLHAPTPYFIELLAHQSALPVSPKTVKQFGSEFVRPENIVTNGAFTLQSFVPNDAITAVKNPFFHDAQNVKIDKVKYYPTEDRGAAMRRFEAGELDTNNDVPLEQVDYLRETFKDQFHVAPYLGTYYYAINTKNEKLADRDVRRALSMVIDRDYLSEEIWGGTMLPAVSYVPPGINNYYNPPKTSWADMDILDREDEAREILAAKGYSEDNPLDVEIRYNTSENHKNTAVAIADMWRSIGVNATLLNTDAKTHYAHLRDGGNFDVARAGWVGDYSDPQNFLFLNESDNLGFNYARFNNKTYDELMKKAAVTVDLKERSKLLEQAEEIFLTEVPNISLLYYSSKNLVADRVSGFEDNVLDVHPSRFISVGN